MHLVLTTCTCNQRTRDKNVTCFDAHGKIQFIKDSLPYLKYVVKTLVANLRFSKCE